MPQTYAEEQIRAALKATSGHPLKTQQRIIAESRTDHRLLQELTQGHMSGIVALWVNRIARKTEDAPPPPVPKPEALNMDPGTFGKEILQALQGRDSVQFGQDTYAPRAGRKKASQAHIDAIKALASKGEVLIVIPALANDHLSSFLAAQGWLDAGYEPFPADWGTRTYARLTKADGRTALLMDMSLDSNLPDYVRIADYLRSVGLHTPEVYAVDERAGLALIEDFGDISFGNRLRRGYNDIYELATDALIQLRDRADRKALDLPVYRDTPYNLGKRRIVDWYVPAARGSKNPDGLAESFLAVWDRIESALPPCPQVICHADYHPENLMLLPGQGCGLIDFQDAFIGPAPYDLANLLEDIRNDVSEDLRAAMKKRYCADMTSQEREAFDSWYRVVATHFHCRVIGQCYKLAVGSGRDDLLTYLPRMEGYMRVALGHPVLAPLADWFVAQGIDFENTPVIMAEDLKPFIREDAY